MGEYFRREIKKIALKNNIEIKLSGLKAIPSFSIIGDKKNIYKTYITQEMLKKGFLINNSVYLCISHNKKILKNFFKNLDTIFKNIRKAQKEKKTYNLLNGKVSSNGFKRLN